MTSYKDMKFVRSLSVLFVLLLFACSDRSGQLIGKWQKSDDSRVIIEFTDSGQYFLEFKGEMVLPQQYSYRPDSKENNLQIGEDTAAVIGQVDFLDDDRILITTTRPASSRGLQYSRIH